MAAIVAGSGTSRTSTSIVLMMNTGRRSASPAPLQSLVMTLARGGEVSAFAEKGLTNERLHREGSTTTAVGMRYPVAHSMAKPPRRAEFAPPRAAKVGPYDHAFVVLA